MNVTEQNHPCCVVVAAAPFPASVTGLTVSIGQPASHTERVGREMCTQPPFFGGTP